MALEHRIGDVVDVINERIGCAERHVVIARKQKRRLEFKMYAIVPVGSEHNALPIIERVGKNRADVVTWYALVSFLSPTTGLAAVRLEDLADAAATNKGNMSRSLRRLQDADLIRHCDECIFNKRTGERASGWILNPDFIVIVEHPRARALWAAASVQARDRELEQLARKVDEAVAEGADAMDAADAITGDDYEKSIDILAKRDAMRRRAA